ncbi:GNAT family N-acetyltransferase [Sphingobium sp. H39-3-25]|uniref:GNAT family N-acetyltransferase n=1 Tax=Sphingobium arseniciresistens TaxID=3030834 RepID=UPI0023BA3AC3|nr:GNAT family N-acetyltransferase [Sphingobium arseniciresistens]
MIFETTKEDDQALVAGVSPRGLRAADSPVAEAAVLNMLCDLAARIRADFAPASWLIVEEGELVGMCSITRPPCDGGVDIGYGIAPTRRGCGIAGRAIGEVVTWAVADPRVRRLTAETGTDNIASQRVLARNGFAVVGERVDDEDGPLICWQRDC